MTKFQHQARPSTFELVTKLLIPVIGLAATLVAQFRGQRLLIWILSAIVLASLGASFGQWTVTRIVRFLVDLHDGWVARRGFEEFRNLVTEFGQFISNSDQRSVLHKIAGEKFSEDHHEHFDTLLDLPDEEQLRLWWSYFRVSVSYLQPSTQTLQVLVNEFSGLIKFFNSRCVHQVLASHPRSNRVDEWLEVAPKGKLNLFRERLLAFMGDYEKYLKRLEKSFAKARVTVVFFDRPEPL